MRTIKAGQTITKGRAHTRAGSEVSETRGEKSEPTKHITEIYDRIKKT